jgi:hypothetical protein
MLKNRFFKTKTFTAVAIFFVAAVAPISADDFEAEMRRLETEITRMETSADVSFEAEMEVLEREIKRAEAERRQQEAQEAQQRNLEQARQRVERTQQARDLATTRATQAMQDGNAELTRQMLETARQANQMFEQAEQEYNQLRREAGLPEAVRQPTQFVAPVLPVQQATTPTQTIQAIPLQQQSVQQTTPLQQTPQNRFDTELIPQTQNVAHQTPPRATYVQLQQKETPRRVRNGFAFSMRPEFVYSSASVNATDTATTNLYPYLKDKAFATSGTGGLIEIGYGGINGAAPMYISGEFGGGYRYFGGLANVGFLLSGNTGGLALGWNLGYYNVFYDVKFANNVSVTGSNNGFAGMFLKILVGRLDITNKFLIGGSKIPINHNIYADGTGFIYSVSVGFNTLFR